MAQQILSTNTFCEAKFVVDADSSQGGYTTIAAALTAATSGSTIFIRPGTYTENLTLKVGVNLSAYDCDALTPNVTILGTCTLTTAGTVSISGICLQTNSAAAIAVTGSAASIIQIKNCNLNFTNTTGITFSSSSASSAIRLFNSIGDLGTTGIGLFTHSSNGVLKFRDCVFTNSGGSSTTSTCSAGTLIATSTSFVFPVTTSGTSAITYEYVNSDSSSQNATALTTGGSGTQLLRFSRFASGSASALSIAGSVTVDLCEINSTNTNSITGSGTINYSELTFSGSSSNINTTTQAILNSGPSSTFGSTNSGNTNTLTVTNTSNTASSNALQQVTVGGTSSGDAFQTFTVSGTTNWSQGVDNSSSDAFVIAASTALGTTNVMSASTAGEINYPLQPAFLAYLNTAVLNVTGDGTEYTVIYDTEVFDQNSDFNLATSVFTASVTGKYNISAAANLLGGTIMSGIVGRITTSNNIYRITLPLNAGITTSASAIGSVLADMDASDTMTFTLQATDTGGKVDDVAGTTSGQIRNWLSAQLSV